MIYTPFLGKKYVDTYIQIKKSVIKNLSLLIRKNIAEQYNYLSPNNFLIIWLWDLVIITERFLKKIFV